MPDVMDDIKKQRSLVSNARREERRTNNEMYNHEQQANHEQSQLDTCLAYKEECLNGLKTAKASGLSIVQIRECQLLVKYLDSVVETRQYKADITQENYQNAKIEWQEKSEDLTVLKQTLHELEIKNGNKMVGDGAVNNDRTYQVYD